MIRLAGWLGRTIRAALDYLDDVEQAYRRARWR